MYFGLGFSLSRFQRARLRKLARCAMYTRHYQGPGAPGEHTLYLTAKSLTLIYKIVVATVQRQPSPPFPRHEVASWGLVQHRLQVSLPWRWRYSLHAARTESCRRTSNARVANNEPRRTFRRAWARDGHILTKVRMLRASLIRVSLTFECRQGTDLCPSPSDHPTRATTVRVRWCKMLSVALEIPDQTIQ